MKNTFNGLTSRLVEEKNLSWKMSVETSQTEMQKEKRMKKKKNPINIIPKNYGTTTKGITYL